MIRSTQVVICAVAAVALASARAHARPTVVALTPIDGDSSGNIRTAVSDALDGDELSLIEGKKVNRAIDKLKVDSALSEKDAKKLAKDLEADAVVQGSLEKDGSAKSIHFKLFVHGKEQKGFSVQFKSVKSEKFKTALKNKMVEKLGAAAPAEDDEADVPKKKHKGDDDADARPAPKHKRDDDDDAPRRSKKRLARTDDSDADAEVDASVERPSPHSANRVAVRLDLGVSAASRSLTWNSRTYDEAPKKYSNSPVPGARIEAELYPLAFSDPKGAAAGLGLGVDYDKTISLKLTVQKMGQAAVQVQGKQSHWSIGPRYRIAFGRTATSPTVTIGVGYGKRSFTTDRTPLAMSTDLDMPDTEYSVIDPGVSARIPLVPAVAFVLGGKGLIVTNAGSITTAAQYGQAKVFGAEAFVGIDFVFGKRFALQIKGEFAQVGFSFSGTGAQANARDGDPSSKDVGGATDRSVGGAATLAVLY